MFNYLSQNILLIAITSYTRLDNNTLLSLHLPIYILLDIDSILIVLFPNLPPNVYSIFQLQLTVIAKETNLNR